MIKLFFNFVIPLAVLMVIGLVGYNYFFGTPQEQANSKKIISQVTGLGTDVANLLLSEQEKLEEGKYDQALDKIGSAIDSLKNLASRAVDGGRNLLGTLQELENQRLNLQEQLDELKNQQSVPQASSITDDGPATARRAAAPSLATTNQIEAQIRRLAEQTEQLASQIGNQ